MDIERIAKGLTKAHIDALNGAPTDDMPSQVALDFIKWKLIKPTLANPFTTASIFDLSVDDVTMAWSPLGHEVRTYLMEVSNAK